MFETTFDNLFQHLKIDLKIENNALIWLHSGISGLGKVNGCSDTITDVFSSILQNGGLVIPSFTYSWCNGETFDPLTSECFDMGGYASVAWKDNRFSRNLNPNFSVSVLDNTKNKQIEKILLDDCAIYNCFGKDSVFDKMVSIAQERPVYILLLGGAHDDVVFRSTFLHYVEEKVGVPYRYKKVFVDPNNRNNSISQYVRYFTKDEYISVNGMEPPHSFHFPVKEKYTQFGNDLIAENMIVMKEFAYSTSRMVSIAPFCEWLQGKLDHDPEYLLR